MKTRVVLFDEHNYAHILINPADDILSLPGALINPDLAAVEHVSPEYWKLDGANIVGMNAAERAFRDLELEHEHASPHVTVFERIVSTTHIRYKVPQWLIVALFLETGGVISMLVHFFNK